MTGNREKLTGRLIGLARATDGNEHLINPSATEVIIKGLCIPEDETSLVDLMERATEEKRKMVPDCFLCGSPCGKNNDFDLKELEEEPSDVRQIKYDLLQGIRELAICAYAAGAIDRSAEEFFYKVLIMIGISGYSAGDLSPVIRELEEFKRKYEG